MPSPLKTQCRICKVEGLEGEVMKWSMSICKACFDHAKHCCMCGHSADYGTKMCHTCARIRDEDDKRMRNDDRSEDYE